MIGKEQLESLKDISKAKSFSELEMIYKLHHDMNLKIAITIGFLEDKWVRSGIKDQNSFRKFVQKLPFYKQLQTECNELIGIRNHIAHGDLLLTKIEEAETVFATVLKILDQEGEKERANQLIFDLKRLCKKGRKISIRRQYPAPEGWKKEMETSHWCKKDIKKLANF